MTEKKIQSILPPKRKFPWFQLFKYSVYSLLILNVLLFLNKEVKAAAHRFSDGLVYSDLIDAFSSTIDTAAWVVLILVFELETYILTDKQLKNGIRWFLFLLKGFSYTVICFAFYGYITKYFWLMGFTAAEASTLCSFIGQSWMIEADQFDTITKSNCTSLSTTSEFLKLSGKNILTDTTQWDAAYRLVAVDIFNAGAWILVVIVLELDIWLQLKNKFNGRIYQMSKIIKGILYTILLGAAIYWGVAGNFLEFWDAFLWIVAFIFIESNLFEWQAENKD